MLAFNVSISKPIHIASSFSLILSNLSEFHLISIFRSNLLEALSFFSLSKYLSFSPLNYLSISSPFSFSSLLKFNLSLSFFVCLHSVSAYPHPLTPPQASLSQSLKPIRISTFFHTFSLKYWSVDSHHIILLFQTLSYLLEFLYFSLFSTTSISKYFFPSNYSLHFFFNFMPLDVLPKLVGDQNPSFLHYLP